MVANIQMYKLFDELHLNMLFSALNRKHTFKTLATSLTVPERGQSLSSD